MKDDTLEWGDAVATAVTALAREQAQVDGEDHVCGEFPMTLWCLEERRDFNFLSGYALLHLAVTSRYLSSPLPGDVRRLLETVLTKGAGVPAAYQGPEGLNNWYHGRLSGDHTPPNFEWPSGVVLSLRDDLDDTAIAALLCTLGPDFRARVPYRGETFSKHIVRPTVPLRPSSTQRLSRAGVEAGVYMTWALGSDAAAPRELPTSGGRLEVPFENSVELITASNIYTAVHRLGAPPDAEAHRASAQFVNGLARDAIAALLSDDPSVMDDAGRYYPRVPFAPISFLLRNHVLCDGALLDDATLAAVANAMQIVRPELALRPEPAVAKLHWLLSAGYAVYLGLLEPNSLVTSPADVCRELIAEGFVGARGFADFVFFRDAHIGHYGGVSYANAVALEALAVARLSGCL